MWKIANICFEIRDDVRFVVCKLSKISIWRIVSLPHNCNHIKEIWMPHLDSWNLRNVSLAWWKWLWIFLCIIFIQLFIGGHAKCAFFRSCGTNGKRKHTTPTQDNLEIRQEDDDAKCAFLGHSNSGVFKIDIRHTYSYIHT